MFTHTPPRRLRTIITHTHPPQHSTVANSVANFMTPHTCTVIKAKRRCHLHIKETRLSLATNCRDEIVVDSSGMKKRTVVMSRAGLAWFCFFDEELISIVCVPSLQNSKNQMYYSVRLSVRLPNFMFFVRTDGTVNIIFSKRAP